MDLRKAEKAKDAKKAMLLHQEWHHKGMPRCALQRSHEEARMLALRNALGVEISMVALCAPKSMKGSSCTE